jgi:hypothetical protein
MSGKAMLAKVRRAQATGLATATVAAWKPTPQKLSVELLLRALTASATSTGKDVAAIRT